MGLAVRRPSTILMRAVLSVFIGWKLYYKGSRDKFKGEKIKSAPKGKALQEVEYNG